MWDLVMWGLPMRDQAMRELVQGLVLPHSQPRDLARRHPTVPPPGKRWLGKRRLGKRCCLKKQLEMAQSVKCQAIRSVPVPAAHLAGAKSRLLPNPAPVREPRPANRADRDRYSGYPQPMPVAPPLSGRLLQVVRPVATAARGRRTPSDRAAFLSTIGWRALPGRLRPPSQPPTIPAARALVDRIHPPRPGARKALRRCYPRRSASPDCRNPLPWEV